MGKGMEWAIISYGPAPGWVRAGVMERCFASGLSMHQILVKTLILAAAFPPLFHGY